MARTRRIAEIERSEVSARFTEYWPLLRLRSPTPLSVHGLRPVDNAR
jgi:hypothetical protein